MKVIHLEKMFLILK